MKMISAGGLCLLAYESSVFIIDPAIGPSAVSIIRIPCFSGHLNTDSVGIRAMDLNNNRIGFFIYIGF